MAFRTLDDIGDVKGKRVLVREDLNVPMDGDRVTDDTRLRAAIPTVNELAEKGAKVLILAHFGRPKGQPNPEMSLARIKDALAGVLGRPVHFINDIKGEAAAKAVDALNPGAVALLENTRFYAGEEKNDPALAAEVAKLGDFYVNDAFSAAHRAHVSTEGLAHKLPAFAGRAMQKELEALEAALGKPTHPVAAVVGGAKVSTKLDVLTNLVSKVDHLIIGGGMANTFLAAQGVDVGKSLCEHELKDTVKGIFAAAEKTGCKIHLPSDVVVAKEFKANPPIRTIPVSDVAADEMILDVGPKAVAALTEVLKASKTLVWNGPLGAFEIEPFDKATVALAKEAAALTKAGSLISVAGGGDTVAALNHAGVAKDFSFVST
ncbi:phosphoglycerate kinase, partial [Zymomonas mobilis]